MTEQLFTVPWAKLEMENVIIIVKIIINRRK